MTFCMKRTLMLWEILRRFHKENLLCSIFFSSCKNRWIVIVLKCVRTIRCLPKFISPLLPPALPLELCFGKKCQSAHLKMFTFPDPMQPGKCIWPCSGQWNSSQILVRGWEDFLGKQFHSWRKETISSDKHLLPSLLPQSLPASALNTGTVVRRKSCLEQWG